MGSCDGASPWQYTCACPLLALGRRWCITSITSGGQVASDTIMSLDDFSEEENLECVKDDLQRGDDVNTKDEYGKTVLIYAVIYQHNSVVALLLNTPNIDVNLKSGRDEGLCALHWAVNESNNEAVKLLLNVPNIDVNIVNNSGESALHKAVHRHRNEALKLLLDVPTIDVNLVKFDGKSAVHHAVSENNIEGLKLLLSHPSLTAITLNMKDKHYGETPVMLAMKLKGYRSRQVVVEVLVADPRVDLDTTDRE